LAAAMHAGRWQWHLAGIGREIHFTKPMDRRAAANSWLQTSPNKS